MKRPVGKVEYTLYGLVSPCFMLFKFNKVVVMWYYDLCKYKDVFSSPV